MKNKVYDENAILDIAEAIRKKNDSTIQYKVSQMEIMTLNLLDSILEGQCRDYLNYDIEYVRSHAFDYYYGFGSQGGEVHLHSVTFPNCTKIDDAAFFNCSFLTTISFPKCSYIGKSAFRYCGFNEVSLPQCTYIGNDAFMICSYLRKIEINECTYIGNNAFYSCPKLNTILSPKCHHVGVSAFYGCYDLTTISFPVCTDIEDYAFYYCRSLTTINLPLCEKLGSSVFYSCSSLKDVYLSGVASVIPLTNNIFSTCKSLSRIIVPYSLYSSFKTSSFWSIYSNKIYSYITPSVYKSLTITANDVSARKTTTNIQCTYIVDGIDIDKKEVQDIEIIEHAISDPFPQNTSETETVQRTITYSNHGLTATTTITQGVYTPLSQEYDLNSQWVDSTKTLDGYDVFMSNSNKGVNNGYASMKITFKNQPDFKLYINSYAESSYDYTIAWEIDKNAPTALPSDTSSGVQATTKSKQSNPTSISNYTEVSYPNDGDEHFVWITYRKDSSGNSNDDRGYVAIPNE